MKSCPCSFNENDAAQYILPDPLQPADGRRIFSVANRMNFQCSEIWDLARYLDAADKHLNFSDTQSDRDNLSVSTSGPTVTDTEHQTKILNYCTFQSFEGSTV